MAAQLALRFLACSRPTGHGSMPPFQLGRLAGVGIDHIDGDVDVPLVRVGMASNHCLMRGEPEGAKCTERGLPPMALLTGGKHAPANG